MKTSSKKAVATKKAGGSKKNRAKRTQSRRPEHALKILVLALANRMRKAGKVRHAPAVPAVVQRTKVTARPGKDADSDKPVGGTNVYRIVGHAFDPSNLATDVACSGYGVEVDNAVDQMEEAIKNDDDSALQDAIKDFWDKYNEGIRSGCYFTYD